MKRNLIRAAIVAVFVLQLFWVLQPRNGSFPRSPETVQAIDAYNANRSAATQATLLAQLRKDVMHNEHRALAILGLMLLGDAVAIYGLWSYGNRRRTA